MKVPVVMVQAVAEEMEVKVDSEEVLVVVWGRAC